MNATHETPEMNMTPSQTPPEALLTLTDFSLWFGKAAEPTIDRVSFAVFPGETHALVGESGSGKSVTALSVLRLLEDSHTVRTSGSIRFAGLELRDLPKERLRAIRGNRISMVFQEPMTALNPVYPVGRQVMEPLLLHRNMSKAEARNRAVELLARTGIDDAARRFDSYPHQLSGGQRQRVLIAMALACEPELLIADEPTTALDVTLQTQILDLIQDLQAESGMAVLLITHDLPMVARRAARVTIMRRGRVVEAGDAETIFRHPKEDYTKTLLAAVPSDAQTPREGGAPLLTLSQLGCRFPAGHEWRGWRRRRRFFTALDGIDFELREGTTLGVAGESGSGKSTLALCILGLLRASGEALYQEGAEAGGRVHALTRLSSRAFRPLRRDLQIVLQDPFASLSPRLTVAAIVGEGLGIHHLGKNRAERLELVSRALRDVDLDPDIGFRYPHEFSGGQRQRIAIARALVLRPRLLILDEPTSALDATIQKQVLELLRRLQDQYKLTYIFITHDLRVLRSVADRVAVMQRGKIVEQGRADEVFAHPEHEYTRRLFQAAFHGDAGGGMWA